MSPQRLERRRGPVKPIKIAGPNASTKASRTRVSSAAVAEFTDALAWQLDAGVTIVEAISVYAHSMPTGPFKAVLEDVAESIQSGDSLEQALAKHPLVFDSLYTSMVQAGQKGGVLDPILANLAEYYQNQLRLRNKIREAITYPVAVLVFAMAVVSFIIAFIVPKFEEIFSQMHQELPAATQLLIGASRAFAAYWYLFVGTPVLLYGGFHMALRSRAFATWVHKRVLGSPIFGMVALKVETARFARTLGTLQQAGVEILAGLGIVQQAAQNIVVANAIGQARESVRQGEQISAGLTSSNVFPELVVRMMRTAEGAGKLPQVCLKVAERFEREVETKISTLLKLLEPLLLVVLALVVGFIVMALFLPILKVMEGMGGAA